MEKLYEKRGDKWINEYYNNGEYIILKLSKPETNEKYDVFIDYCDYERVKEGQWFVSNKRKNSKFKDIYDVCWSKIINNKKYNYSIYQYILGTKGSKCIIDHINMNRFDNRRCNLRFVNAQENRINQQDLGYRYEEKHNKYLVRISINKKAVNIGRYKTEQEANEVYLKSCIILGYDKISSDIANRIQENNIIITMDDYSKKYIKKVIAIRDDTYIEKEFNGRFNNEYDKNINTIVELRNKGMSWRAMSKYFRENNLIKNANDMVLKKRYLEQITL